MSTVTVRSGSRLDALHPAIAAGLGALTFATTMIGGDLLDLNADTDGGPSTSLLDLMAYAGLVLAAYGLAVWLGTRSRAGAPGRLSRTALGLALASAATFVGFWSGWPHVFAAVAIALALEHRRRVGAFSGVTTAALVLGAISFVATSIVCLVG